MATATKKKPEKKADKKIGGSPGVLIALPCRLKGKSTSPKKISIGCTIAKEFITPSKAYDLLVFRRITAKLAVGKVAAATAAGQGKLPGLEDVDHEIEAVIQTSRVSMGDEDYSITLNFNLKELDGDESKLAGFAGRDALLTIKSVGELTADDLDDEDPDAPDEEADDDSDE